MTALDGNGWVHLVLIMIVWAAAIGFVMHPIFTMDQYYFGSSAVAVMRLAALVITAKWKGRSNEAQPHNLPQGRH